MRFFSFFIFILTPGRIYEINNLTWLVAPERGFLSGVFIFEHPLVIPYDFCFGLSRLHCETSKLAEVISPFDCTSPTSAIRSVDRSNRFTFAKPRSAPANRMDARSSVVMRADPGTPRLQPCDMHVARDQRRRPVVRLSARHSRRCCRIQPANATFFNWFSPIPNSMTST